MSQENLDCAPKENEAVPLMGKRRSPSSTYKGPYSARKRRRISLASIDLSRELQSQVLLDPRTETTADRFIPARPKFANQMNTTPRTTRIAKGWGLADDRILNFSDHSAPIPAPQFPMHSLLRKSASQLFESPSPAHSTSSLSNIARRKHAIVVLDGPGISINPYAYPFSWSSKNLIAVAFGAVVYYQDMTTRKTVRLRATQPSVEPLHTIQWGSGASEDLLALGAVAGRVSLCNAVAEKEAMRWTSENSGGMGGMDWYENVLAVGRQSGKVSLYDSRLLTRMNELDGHKAKVRGVKWSTDGRYLASGDHEGSVYIWDARADKFFLDSEEKGRRIRHRGPVKALAWCPWQPDLLATGGNSPDGCIRIWSATSTMSPLSPLHTIPLNASITSLHWSRSCKELLSTHGAAWSSSPFAVAPTSEFPDSVPTPISNSVTVHAYPSCKRLVSVPAHLGEVSHSCLSPDGSNLFTVSGWDEAMKMWAVWGVREDAGKRESVFDKYAIR